LIGDQVFAILAHKPVTHLQACDYIMMNKEMVPFLRQARLQLTSDLDTNADLVLAQLSTENLEVLNTVTRDFLVFLAPGQTKVKSSSVLKLPWALGREASLRDSLFISSHPAFLPHVLAYFDSRDVKQEDLPAAWLQLSEESSASQFLTEALTDLPAISAFVTEFVSNRTMVRVDAQPVYSRQTIRSEDSGVFSGQHDNMEGKGVKRRGQEDSKGESKKAKTTNMNLTRAGRMVQASRSNRRAVMEENGVE
jgi:hypothetical protein